MSDIANSAERITERVQDTAAEVLTDATNTADDFGARHAASAERVNGKLLLFGVGSAAVVSGFVWLAYRMAKRTVKHHPAVRVARAGLHVVRDH